MNAGFRYFILILLLLAAWPAAWGDDKTPESAWSPAVHGLRARIFTKPSTEPEYDKTFDVWIEFQETGLDTSLVLQHRSLTVRFSRPFLQLTVTTPKKTAVAVTPLEGSQPVWDLIFPPGGDLSFPIGTGGSSPHSVPGQTPPKGRLLSFDATGEWLIPLDDGPYDLGMTFEVSDSGQPDPGSAGAPTPTTNAAPVSVPTDAATTTSGTSPYHGWTGTLVLPPIDLPEK